MEKAFCFTYKSNIKNLVVNLENNILTITNPDTTYLFRRINMPNINMKQAINKNEKEIILS